MMGAGAERSLAELAQEIASAAVRLAAATALWLRSIGEFDAREGWAGCGIRSCAHWLAWQCGLSPGTAREHVRVARALRDLPVIAAAFDSGRLSYAEVRALTRVAEPVTEAELLAFAVEATASQPERTVRQWRRAGAAGETPPAAPRERFDYWWEDDGSLVAHLRLGPERGAAFLDAVNSLAERAARRERAAAKRQDTDREGSGSADPPERPTAAPVCDADEDDEVAAGRERSTARRCAALAALADAAADADRRAGDPPRCEAVLHVDAAVLADDAAGRARLDGGPALTPAQARRTLCDARVLIMLEAGREVLAHGRTRRRASRAQRRALLRRDGRVIVTTPDGRRIRGAVDAAFSTGLDGLPVLSGPGTHGAETGAGHTSEPSAGCSRSDHPAFTGVHHSDGARARRPRVTAGPLPQPDQQAAGRRAGPKNSPASAGARPATVGGLLFPRGEPVPRRRCTSTAKG